MVCDFGEKKKEKGRINDKESVDKDDSGKREYEKVVKTTEKGEK